MHGDTQVQCTVFWNFENSGQPDTPTETMRSIVQLLNPRKRHSLPKKENNIQLLSCSVLWAPSAQVTEAVWKVAIAVAWASRESIFAVLLSQ
jgi:hypothetical protein